MTTVTTIAALGLTAAISVAAMVTLIIFLGSQELATAGQSRLSWRITRFASVGVLPLLMAFAVIVAAKIIELV